MNKYEKLFLDIVAKTNSGEMEWKQIKKSANESLIFNPDMVFRQDSADLKRTNEIYKVVFVEKKSADPEHDFAFEKYIPEILIIDKDGELIVTLTDSVIERSHLITQMQNIQEKNDKTKKLFE